MLRSLKPVMGWLVALGCSAVTVPAQDAADRPDEPGPTAAQRELVQQLGDASHTVRDEAAKKLVLQGATAKDVLTEALTDPDPEIRSRAHLILHRILPAARAEDTVDQLADPGPTAAQRELVQQLGDPSFFTRERAAEKLASLGVAVKAALMEALKDPDFEIRWQARTILKRVLQDAFEARLVAFIADVDGKEGLRLPGWERFRDLAGDRRDVRKMFAEMTRSEGALLLAYEKQAPELPELFTARVAWLQSHAARGSADNRFCPPQTVATLLLIGADKTLKDHSRSISPLYQLLNHSNAMQSLAPRPVPSILRTLLEKWATSAASSGSSYGMMLALKYDLKQTGLQQATEILDRGTTSSSTLHYAIITVGRFGGEEHIRLLTPLLENKTVCHRWSNRQLKKEGTINVEVRDAALVVLLRVKGQDPAKFGFKLLRDNPETLYYVYTFGFIDDEEREAAHAKWAAESKAGEG
jgi:hypothetical protein